MEVILEGRARKLGESVSAESIAASGLPDSMRPGDLIVAGSDFGAGTAVEAAAAAIAAKGIKAVLAKSFAGAFYQTAVSNGVIPLACDTTTISDGNRLSVRLRDGILTVRNFSTCVQESVALAIPGERAGA